MMKKKLNDGIVLGALLGLTLTTPSISVWVSDLLNSIIPLSAYIFGNFSLPIFGVLIGAFIGLIIDKT